MHQASAKFSYPMKDNGRLGWGMGMNCAEMCEFMQGLTHGPDLNNGCL